MAEQLSIFAKPKTACETGPIRYAVKVEDLAGKTIKEQLTQLCLVATGKTSGTWFTFDRLIQTKGYDILDVRDGWIECPADLSARVCELFRLAEFPIHPAPMDPPKPLGRPYFETVMEKPENEFVKSKPRDSYVILAQGNPYHPVQERHVLGPYQTHYIDALPLADRAEVIAFWRQHPHLSHCVDVMGAGSEEKPRKQMSEEAKRGIRLLNLMRRCVKKYGMLAEEFARAEVDERGMEWSDATWERANLPPKASNVKAKRQARRKSDNDELLSGAK